MTVTEGEGLGSRPPPLPSAPIDALAPLFEPVCHGARAFDFVSSGVSLPTQRGHHIPNVNGKNCADLALATPSLSGGQWEKMILYLYQNPPPRRYTRASARL